MATFGKLARKSLPPLAYLKSVSSKKSSPGPAAGSKRACNGGIFCTGFMSYMRATKAAKLEEYFTSKNLDFVRFDYTDVGESVDPSIPAQFSFRQWHRDALTALTELTDGPQILIGSSMGAWMALLAALEMPEKVAGLLLIAPGVDFFERFMHWLPSERQEEYEKGKIIMLDGPFGAIPVHKRLLTESEPLKLLHKSELPINCPVRMIHATGDPYTPYDVSVQLLSKLTSHDIQVHLVKSDDHRMSTEEDLKMITLHLDSLLDRLNNKHTCA